MRSFLKKIFSTPSNTAITRVSSTVFKQQLKAQSGIQLIDVRTANEYRGGHIKNAKSIDFFSNDFSVRLQKLNSEKPLYIYCRSGMRSYKAAKIAAKLGFTTIIDLKGGYNTWH